MKKTPYYLDSAIFRYEAAGILRAYRCFGWKPKRTIVRGSRGYTIHDGTIEKIILILK